MVEGLTQFSANRTICPDGRPDWFRSQNGEIPGSRGALEDEKLLTDLENAVLGVISQNQPCTAYAVRMVEQVCHIESYRQRLSQERGRDISSEEAAQEWISHYAADFPQ